MKNRPFSADQKLDLHQFLKQPLLMRSGQTIKMEEYLFTVLPDLLRENEVYQKEKMGVLMELLELSAKRFDDGPNPLQQVKNLKWEDGSMERFWGPEEEVAERLMALPEKYFRARDEVMDHEEDAYASLATPIMNAYQGALLAQQLRESMGEFLENVCRPVLLQPAARASQSMIDTMQDLDTMLTDTRALEVLLKVPRDDVRLAHLEKASSEIASIMVELGGNPDDEEWIKDMGPAYQLMHRSMREFNIDDARCPKDPAKFCNDLKAFVSSVHAMVMQRSDRPKA